MFQALQGIGKIVAEDGHRPDRIQIQADAGLNLHQGKVRVVS